MRAAALVVVSLGLGCTSSESVGPDSALPPTDAAIAEVAPDATILDGSTDGSNDASTPAKCGLSVAGSTPFGTVLGTDGLEFVRSGGSSTTLHLRIDTFFPAGRVPGKRVVLSHGGDGCVLRRLRTSEHVVDSTSAVTFKANSIPPLGIHLVGALLAPTDGFFGDVHLLSIDGFPGDDVIVERVAKSATLCPVSDVAAPTLTVTFARAPTSEIFLAASAPLDPATIEVSVKTEEGAAVATSTSHDQGLLTVRATSAFPPGKRLLVDVSKLRDVIGRSFTAPAMLDVLTTSAVVTDRTFDTDPPLSATSGGTTVAGRFRASVSAPLYAPKQVGALIALGDPGVGKSVRVRLGGLDCSTPTTRVDLVAAGGERANLPIPCDGAGPDAGVGSVVVKDVVVLPPATGPLWLSIAGGPTSCASGLGSAQYRTIGVEIDAFSFE